MNLKTVLHSGLVTVNNKQIILAVDDNEDNLLLLTEVLEPLNCLVMTATHGQTALLLAQGYQPDLILLDVMLPDVNGIEVVQRLKQNEETAKIPVVAVTALAREEDRDRLILAGCNNYISKPYLLEDLEALIRQYLPPIPSAA
jgi:CheY-like chemotaxis protein